MSFWTLVSENRRSLNAVRLVLALLVLFSHAYPLGSGIPDPQWPGFGTTTSIGGFAVGAFFALSGLLVTKSAMSRSTKDFLVQRVFRIYPAYVCALLLSVIFVGPIASFAEGQPIDEYINLQPNGPVTYLLRNFFLPLGLQFNINSLLLGNPFPGAFNGSLWTLPIEVRAYLIIAILGLLAKLVGSFVVVIGFDLLLLSHFVVNHASPTFAEFVYPTWLTISPHLFANFFVGATVAVFATRIRAFGLTTCLFVLAFALSEFIGGVFFLTFGLGSLAVVLPLFANSLHLSRFSLLDNDISYGVYLYAFPIQQLIVLLYPSLDLVPYLVSTTLVTLLLAIFSWRFVESKFINAGKKLSNL